MAGLSGCRNEPTPARVTGGEGVAGPVALDFAGFESARGMVALQQPFDQCQDLKDRRGLGRSQILLPLRWSRQRIQTRSLSTSMPVFLIMS